MTDRATVLLLALAGAACGGSASPDPEETDTPDPCPIQPLRCWEGGHWEETIPAGGFAEEPEPCEVEYDVGRSWFECWPGEDVTIFRLTCAGPDDVEMVGCEFIPA